MLKGLRDLLTKQMPSCTCSKPFAFFEDSAGTVCDLAERATDTGET